MAASRKSLTARKVTAMESVVTGTRTITAWETDHVIEFRTRTDVGPQLFGAYCQTCSVLINASNVKGQAFANVQAHCGTFGN